MRMPPPHAHRRPWRLLEVVGLAGALASAGCGGTPAAVYSIDTTPLALTSAHGAGVRDLRGAYRWAFCRRLPSPGPTCDDVLLRLGGEPAPPADGARPGLPGRYRIAFVPGFLAECLDGIARPFSDVMESLSRNGFDVHHLPVAGRGTSAGNADQLARELGKLPADTRPVIVVAYSKGLPDLLEMVVRHPAAAESIAAIVSVAGAVNGSLLADRLHPALRAGLSSLPLTRCRQGTGSELVDLQRDTRVAWWDRHGAEVTAPVFALVAAPRSEHVSPVLWETHRQLAQIEPRNDGLLLWYDQVIPGGSLLGYVDADHLAVAVPFARALSGLMPLFPDTVPRTALIEAAIEVVDRVLGDRGAATRERRTTRSAVVPR